MTKTIYIGAIKPFEVLAQIADVPAGSVITTNSAGAMQEAFGDCEYYGINMPRNTRVEDTKQVRELYNNGEITLTRYRVERTDDLGADLIVGRHAATNELLQEIFPGVPGLTGNVSESDIAGKRVVGVLPPHLVAKAKSMASFVIPQYNFATDGDMTLAQLKDRGGFLSRPITLKEV